MSEGVDSQALAKATRAELLKRVLIVVTAIMVATVLVLLVVVLFQVRSTQLEGTPTGRKLVSSADRILDCTDPDGDCYQENLESTAELLGTVQRIIVLAAACAVDVTPAQTVDARESQITACITQRLAAG